MSAKNKSLDSLTTKEQDILQKVQKAYELSLQGAVNEAASDVYGGITNNIIHGTYGHWGYYATCNKKAMNAFIKRFPNAKKFLDEMAESMATRGEK